jgi:type I restriction enzyme M protein
MLDTATKRRIDTARDILVGKVPDPKSQVEQITIALIYKFMDDMDAEAEEMGGNRKFFAGDFARYGWAKLMRSGLGGHETLNLYAEAIAKMPENPGIPLLFRDIFKNAYLPYRDPETLKSFLKVIDEFDYDHSERLGDAFEYLLSVLGSQGDAGQFRTPRHIIDFMVQILDPKKEEIILDPACGTAGFLISSYKHILRANTDAHGNSTLTPDEKGRLARNIKGYDISPDMVRLSLVNLYLHGFVDPHIEEYDTLTSEEKWNEFADVILANPPFMSPKGGIKPHRRFSVQSKRSEVLFVDYMAEHLTPNGRAGIIVPEGIIFQSGTSYKQLRKMLVDKSLVAVISLPAGVFQPYSGVKTSILILDKALARRSNSVAFFKVENDGFGLGAQRRAIEKNDLSAAFEFLKAWFSSIGSGREVLLSPNALIVLKEKIAENGDYNLSGERYRENGIRTSVFPLKQFEEVCTLEYGSSLPKEKRVEGQYPVVGSNGITGYHNNYLVEGPTIVVGRKGSAGEVTLIEQNCFPIDTTYYVKHLN